MTTDYAGLVEYIVKNIVENPEAVEIDGNSKRHRSQTIEVRLDPSDVGRVIGKGGKNIEAIRAVVKAAAIKEHQRVNVEVVTDDDDVASDDGDGVATRDVLSAAPDLEPDMPAMEPAAGEAAASAPLHPQGGGAE